MSGSSPGPPGQGHGTGLTLGEVLREALAPPRPVPSLSAHHRKVIGALVRCRTSALGAHHYQCAHCRGKHVVPHSCRNRHCPTCQGDAARRWLAQQEALLLPVPYFHTVFTLPHRLNPLIAQNQASLYALLFDTAAGVLLDFGRNNLGVQLGFTAVLHTWSQTLLDHYHLHVVVPGGGIALNGTRWIHTEPKFLFPVRALSKVFRARFLDGLRQLRDQQKLEFHGALQALSAPPAFEALLSEAAAPDWVVYTKAPFAGPEQVLRYLSRYTHRVAISNRRLLGLDREAGTVRFRYRDYADHSRSKCTSLPLAEFLRRWSLHIVPPRFVRIRHYGLLGNRQRHQRIERARQLLGVALPRPPQPPPPAVPIPCPHCGHEALVLIRITRPPPVTRSPPVLDSS